MKDNWTKLNELSQNLIGLAIIATFLYQTTTSEAGTVITGFAAAVLGYFGFKAVKSNNNGQ